MAIKSRFFFKRSTIAAVLGSGLAALSSAPVFACPPIEHQSMGAVCMMAFYFTSGGDRTGSNGGCPDGYMIADGRILETRDYGVLYTLLRNRFGGVENKTFALPDLRNRAPVGAALTTNGTPLSQRSANSLTPRTFSYSFGAEAVTLSLGQMPVHHHPIEISDDGLKVRASIPVRTANTTEPPQLTPGGTVHLAAAHTVAGSNGLKGLYAAGEMPKQTNQTMNATIQVDTKVGRDSFSGPAGGRDSVPTVSPGIPMLYCIAVRGEYPMRSDD